MALYKTTRTHEEESYGIVRDIFIISDDYAQLENWETAVEVSVFDIEYSSSVLDANGSSDERSMPFSLLRRAASTADDLAAIALALSAQTIGTLIFCGRIINPLNSPALPTDFAFRGVVQSSQQGESYKWSGDDFSVRASSLRDWRLTAKSVSVGALLREEKIIDLVRGKLIDGSETEYEIPPIDSTWIAANVADRTGYHKVTSGYDFPISGHREARFANLVAFEVAIQKLLDQSALTGITINYVSSETDLLALPAWFNTIKKTANWMGLDYTAYTRYVGPYNSTTKKFDLYKTIPETGLPLTLGGTTANGSLYISWHLLNPIDSERAISWADKTLSEIIFSISWVIGLVPRFEYVSNTEINVRFGKRSAVGSTEFYLIDAIAESVQVSGSLVDKETIPTNAVCAWAREGYFYAQGKDGVITSGLHRDGTLADSRFLGFAFGQLGLNDSRQIASDKNIPLTIGGACMWLMGRGADSGYNFSRTEPREFPFIPNGSVWYEKINDVIQRGTKAVGIYPQAWAEYNRETVDTTMYIKTTGRPDGDGEIGVNGVDTWRPIAAIASKIDGTERQWGSLLEYALSINQQDKTYYDNEITIKVPGLCGFRATPMGPSGWQYIQEGYRINIFGAEYIVNQLKRNKIDTEITLHARSRFSNFTDPDGGTLITNGISPQPLINNALSADNSTLEFSSGADIAAFTFVSRDDMGGIKTALNTASEYGKVIGIAAEGFDSEVDDPNKTITVVTQGELSLGYDTALDRGAIIYLKSGSPNWGANPDTSSGKYLLELGRMKDRYTISVDIRQPGYFVE